MTTPIKVGEAVLFDEESQKWIYHGRDDGITYEFDEGVKGWFPRLTNEILQAQSDIYKVEGVDESVPVEKPALKRKREKANIMHQPEKRTKPAAETAKKNTAVYVSGLPLDATAEEIADVFKKGGVFLLDPITSLPKIKLYHNANDEFEGNALVIYLREESVILACQLLDETPFRFTDKDTIRVQPAVFKEKEKKEEDPNSIHHVDKKTKQRIFQKMTKQLEWFEEEKTDTKSLKCVVLKHMFTLEQLRENPALLLDLKMDVRTECEKFGIVNNVTLFDLEEDGVMLVKFKTPEAALACVEKMDNRFYDGRSIAASISTGREKYAKSKRDSEEEERTRQEEYAKWLESQNDE